MAAFVFVDLFMVLIREWKRYMRNGLGIINFCLLLRVLMNRDDFYLLFLSPFFYEIFRFTRIWRDRNIGKAVILPLNRGKGRRADV